MPVLVVVVVVARIVPQLGRIRGVREQAGPRGVGRGRGRAGELERVDRGDLAEERHDREPHESPVGRDHGLDGHERALREDDDDRLLGGGEVAHHGNHADDERALRRVGDERLLAVEERDLRGLEHVAAFVALGGVDEEIRLDVAEDGETELRARGGVESAELRHGQSYSCPA